MPLRPKLKGTAAGDRLVSMRDAAVKRAIYHAFLFRVNCRPAMTGVLQRSALVQIVEWGLVTMVSVSCGGLWFD